MAGRITLWQNVPHWPPLYRKLQQHSTAPTYNPTLDALYTDTDSPRSNSTEFEPSPEGSTVPVAERPKISPEIPETPTDALENMQPEESTTTTTVILLLIYVHACRQKLLTVTRQSLAMAAWMLRRGGLSFVIDPITTTIHFRWR